MSAIQPDKGSAPVRMPSFEENVRSRFERILVDQLGVDESDLHGNPDIIWDLGADSLDQVEIIMACEVEFQIDICDEDAEKCHKVSDAVTFLIGELSRG